MRPYSPRFLNPSLKSLHTINTHFDIQRPHLAKRGDWNMSSNVGMGDRNNSYCKTAILIVIILVITTYSPIIDNSQISQNLQHIANNAGESSDSVEHWSGPDTFHPLANQSAINQTLNSSIQIPYNQT